MLFSSGTLGRFLTILTGTLANPSMYCSGHNNLPPLRLLREGKLIIPETFKLFPDISYGLICSYRHGDRWVRSDSWTECPSMRSRSITAAV